MARLQVRDIRIGSDFGVLVNPCTWPILNLQLRYCTRLTSVLLADKGRYYSWESLDMLRKLAMCAIKSWAVRSLSRL